MLAKQSSCSRACQQRFNVSKQWPLKSLCQGCQEPTISDPGLMTDPITTLMLNNSVSLYNNNNNTLCGPCVHRFMLIWATANGTQELLQAWPLKQSLQMLTSGDL